LSVGDGLLGEIVIDDKSMHGVVSEVLSDGASRIWSQELEWCGIRCGGGNNTGVFHSSEIGKGLDDVSNGGSLLSDSDVNAMKFL